MATGDYLGDLRAVDHRLESGPALRRMKGFLAALLSRIPTDVAFEAVTELPDGLAMRRPERSRDVSLNAFLADFHRRGGLGPYETAGDLEGAVLHEARVAMRLVDEMLPGATVHRLHEALPEPLRILAAPTPGTAAGSETTEGRR